MLGENIVKFRKKAKLSQEELAELMDCARQTISNWELGETSPTAEQVIELSKIFKVSADELLGMDTKDIVIEKVNGTEKLVKKQIKFTKILFITIYVLVLIFLLGIGIHAFTLKDFTKKNQLEFTCSLDNKNMQISLESGGMWQVLNCNSEECPRTFNAKEELKDYLYVIKAKDGENEEYYTAGFSFSDAVDSLNKFKEIIIQNGGICR